MVNGNIKEMIEEATQWLWDNFEKSHGSKKYIRILRVYEALHEPYWSPVLKQYVFFVMNRDLSDLDYLMTEEKIKYTKEDIEKLIGKDEISVWNIHLLKRKMIKEGFTTKK